MAVNGGTSDGLGSGVERVLGVGATLGEGPLWLDDALWFVDIKQHKVHRFDPATGDHRTWTAPAQVGWVQPMADGGMLAGLQTGLHRFDPADGSFTHLHAVEPDAPGNRLNDSTVDAAGRLWFGSMDDGESTASGLIYRADADGVAPVVDGIVITNGPAVSPDGTTLYHCDTLAGTIHACTIGDDGSLRDTRVFAAVDVATQGYPDGPIVDAEGHVWVSFYGGWCVRRYAPDGTQVAEVRLPVSNVTKIAIGGADGRTAYVTTASKGLSDEDRARQPLAGDVFTFDAGVAGQPAYEITSSAFRPLDA
ncbi:sugar lactone lactonase YvrE [Sphingomonas sp. PP-F2F-A104-K0414]|uniref:SMP-30/gluconolactonase/LRE family protein n=1 Tax=Sphingomonas sp. PP-F2F-A104-K0414 TaxID=2135661 RepID=UPI001044EC32|nr:SMP-30/gluconolactonase/LRE family protein [Sphingomonas sp. PP-F2F-A104-K0414]TCP98575.1 sugar lactone lactonase YvrE [Sphingomonas sp. PP-F2F-A104-K0414]